MNKKQKIEVLKIILGFIGTTLMYTMIFAIYLMK